MKIIILLLVISALQLSGCGNKVKQPANVSTVEVCDTTYKVQKSDDSTFTHIYGEFIFYRKSVNNYSLPPNSIDLEHWIRIAKIEDNGRLAYFARIVGFCDDKVFYFSGTHHYDIRYHYKDNY